MNQLTKAASDVLAERARQVNAEGWTPEHDDEHVDGSMARAAACYVEHACSRGWVYQDFEDGPQRYASEAVPFRWPDAWDASWWKPKNPRRDLVRAAALLLAEIERLDRAPAPGVSVRCPLCGYQHGHAVGCANNPVDIALAAGVAPSDGGQP